MFGWSGTGFLGLGLHKNKWKSNYYSFPRFLPKLIWGSVKTRYYWEDPKGHKHYYYRLGFNFDWHPAKVPYMIRL